MSGAHQEVLSYLDQCVAVQSAKVHVARLRDVPSTDTISDDLIDQLCELAEQAAALSPMPDNVRLLFRRGAPSIDPGRNHFDGLIKDAAKLVSAAKAQDTVGLQRAGTLFVKSDQLRNFTICLSDLIDRMPALLPLIAQPEPDDNARTREVAALSEDPDVSALLNLFTKHHPCKSKALIVREYYSTNGVSKTEKQVQSMLRKCRRYDRGH